MYKYIVYVLNKIDVSTLYLYLKVDIEKSTLSGIRR